MLEGVSKTALFTLRARAEEHGRADRRFADPDAVAWLEALGWPDELSKFYSAWIQAKTAIRTVQIDRMVRLCQERFEVTQIVELACGLSSRRQRLGFEGAWLDVDLPAVIAARTSLGIEGSEQLAASALDLSWIDHVEVPDQTIVIAEGLVYYLPIEEVDALFTKMRERIPGAVVVLDVIGELDFDAAKRFSARLDAPIHWAVAPPFEAAMDAMGLDTIEGLEPDVVLDEALSEIRGLLRPVLSTFARVGVFRDRRSGTMVGRLRAT